MSSTTIHGNADKKFFTVYTSPLPYHETQVANTSSHTGIMIATEIITEILCWII